MPSPNISPHMSSILTGVALSMKKGDGNTLSGGGVPTIRTMMSMYFIAILGFFYAQKQGKIPNIEVVVRYIFEELLEQKGMYNKEKLHMVLETIYVTYTHLGEDQERPLACHDSRDVGYIVGEYEPRAGSDCDKYVEAFGVTVSTFCLTLLLSISLSIGISVNLFSNKARNKELTETNKELTRTNNALTQSTEASRDTINELTRTNNALTNEVARLFEKITQHEIFTGTIDNLIRVTGIDPDLPAYHITDEMVAHILANLRTQCVGNIEPLRWLCPIEFRDPQDIRDNAPEIQEIEPTSSGGRKKKSHKKYTRNKKRTYKRRRHKIN